MKKLFKLKFIIPMFILLLLVSSTVFYIKYLRTENSPLISDDNTIKIVIKEGDNLYKVLQDLETENKLRSSFFSKLYIKQYKLNIDIKPGEYNVRTETNLKNLISLFAEGGDTIKLTFPEGFTIEDIANRLDKNGIVEKDEFLNACNNYKFPSYIKQDSNKKYNLEGYLFPDTYVLSKKVKADDIIKAMISRLEEVINELEIETGVKVEENDYEKYINIASMIEKEARLDKDRALISSVIENRLNKKMRLEMCSTVIYASGEHKEVLYNKDLEIKSPYNTYKNYGLPIGPISNPGKPSLKAAIKPAETKYLFYVLQKDNSHYFTDDYKEHEKKKKELGL